MTPELRERLARAAAHSAGLDWDEMPEKARLDHATYSVRGWWLDRVDALLAEALSAGWKLTPREPDEGMVQTALETEFPSPWTMQIAICLHWQAMWGAVK